MEPDGAVQMWTTLAAVLRGRWWRRPGEVWAPESAADRLVVIRY